MRKIFRMQYEPCNGDCYAWDDVLPLVDVEGDIKHLKELMDKFILAHNPLCGNINLRYGIDFDEQSRLFIGSFWHYGKLELFTNSNSLVLVEQLLDYAIAHYKTDIGKAELATDSGLGHRVCHYDEDKDLRRFIVKASGIKLPYGVDAFLSSLN